ncbi:MAG: WD40 repeat domain-containing protein [Candidatus Promineifilaceae bacterium]|nr:WD40 repeat domain-containing protein [Candidatus Promineifilaceae bacterium]
MSSESVEQAGQDKSEKSGGVHFEGGRVKIHGPVIGGDVGQIVYGLSEQEVVAFIESYRKDYQHKFWDGRFPYLGLNVFQTEDAPFFFGREELVAELLDRVRETRFIVISGPSGSGKSSLARAGLFFALREGRNEASDKWFMATMSPKANPIKQLARAIAQQTGTPEAGDYFLRHAAGNPQALHESVESMAGMGDDPRRRFVLLVDQFEEIFTETSKEEERAVFIQMLTEAADIVDGRVTVIISLRSDFLSNCASYPELLAQINKSNQFQMVGSMNPRELARAITLPALEVGADIQPDLVRQIISEMKGEPGALPLMSFALQDLFAAEKSAKGQPVNLSRREYLDRGGINSALQRHADAVFASFSEDEKDVAKNVFRRLVNVADDRADTRRTAEFGELLPANADPRTADMVAAVVTKLAQPGVRLVTTSADQLDEYLEDAKPTVTIAHEKLIEAWPWLQKLVEENREVIALERQIRADAVEWSAARDAGYLYREGRLVQVEERLEALKPNLDALSLEFIRASLDQRKREIEEDEAQQRRELEAARALAAEAQAREKAEIEARNAAEAQREAEEGARREAETAAANLRRRAYYLLGALIAAAVLAAAALLFYRNATINERAAEENLRQVQIKEAEAVAAQATAEAEAIRTRSQALVVASQLWLDSDPMKSLLLAVEASRLADTRNAFQSINQALLKLPDLALSLDTGPIREAMWLEDGTHFIFVTEDNSAQIWDALNYQMELEIDANVWDEIAGEKGLHSIELNKDRKLALTFADEAAAVWDLSSGEMVHELRQSCDLRAVSWNADESRILTICQDGPSQVWDAHSGRLAYELAEGQADKWCDDGTCILGFGPRPEILSEAAEVTAYQWDADSGDVLLSNSLAHRYMHFYTWRSDGTRVRTESDEIDKVWDGITGEFLYNLPADPRRTFRPQWNLDGSRILDLDSDGEFNVWDANTGTLVYSEVSPTDRYWDVHWSEDGSKIITLTEGNNLDHTQILQADNGAVMVSFQIPDIRDFSTKISWNPEATRLITAQDEKLLLWDFTRPLAIGLRTEDALSYVIDGDSYGDFRSGSSRFSWSDDGLILATVGYDKLVRMWDDVKGHIIKKFLIDESVNHLALNGNGSRLLTINHVNQTKVWDTSLGVMICELPPMIYFDRIKFNFVESQVEIRTADNTWELWDTESCAKIYTRDYHDGSSDITWTARGRRLLEVGESFVERPTSESLWNGNNDRFVTFTAEGILEIRRADDSQVVASDKGDYSDFTPLAWNPDKSMFAVEDFFNTIKVWDVDNGVLLPFTLEHPSFLIGPPLWSEDSQYIVTNTEKGANIWNAVDGSLVHFLPHLFSSEPSSTDPLVSWNEQMTRFLTQEHGEHMTLWDDSGNALYSIDQKRKSLWSADKRRILTLGMDGKARVIDAETGEISHLLTLDSEITDINWFAADQYILTGSTEDLVHVWESRDGSRLYSMEVVGWATDYIEWYEDKNRSLYVGYDQVFVWDSDNGDLLVAVTNDGPVNFSEVIADGRNLLLIGENWIRIYDLESGDLLLTLEERDQEIVDARWKEDDQRLTIVTSSGLVWQYQYWAEGIQLRNAACQSATRNLTWTEWQTYFPGQPYRCTCSNLSPQLTSMAAADFVELQSCSLSEEWNRD